MKQWTPAEYEAGEPYSVAADPNAVPFDVLGIDDIDSLEPAEPLVDGLLYKGTLAQLAGPPGGGKTFLVVGMIVAIAAQVSSWQTHKVNASKPVLMVAAEGASGLKARVRAAAQQNSIPMSDLLGRIFFYTEAVQLGSRTDVLSLIRTIVERDCELVVIDTRALCTAGLNENDAAEQAIAINHLLWIIRETSCTVLVVHHNAKGGTGPRGSSAWDGQVWSDIRIENKPDTAGVFEVKIEKHKDAQSGMTYGFQLLPVELEGEYARTQTGPIHPKYRHTLAAVDCDVAHTIALSDPQQAAKILDILRDYAPAEGMTQKTATENHGIAKPTFNREIRRLEDQGKVRNVGPKNRSQWVVTALGDTA